MFEITVNTKEGKRVAEICRVLPRELLGSARVPIARFVAKIGSKARRLAPLRYGHLRESETFDVASVGATIRATIWFGGMAAPYAEIQHEREDFKHPKAGTHHYLYGWAHSAWETVGPQAKETLAKDARRIALTKLRRR